MPILSNASSYVKPGGRLLYTTCTLNRSENYEVVRSFLSQHPEFQVLPVSELARQQDIRVMEQDGTVTILPSEELDGFLCCAAAKTERGADMTQCPCDGPVELRSLLPEQLAELMLQMGEPAYRAKQIFSWCAKGRHLD